MIAIIYWSVRTELIQFASVIYHCCSSKKKSPTKRYGLAEQKFAPRPQITDNGRANKLSGAQPPLNLQQLVLDDGIQRMNEQDRGNIIIIIL